MRIHNFFHMIHITLKLANLVLIIIIIQYALHTCLYT